MTACGDLCDRGSVRYKDLNAQIRKTKIDCSLTSMKAKRMEGLQRKCVSVYFAGKFCLRRTFKEPLHYKRRLFSLWTRLGHPDRDVDFLGLNNRHLP